MKPDGSCPFCFQTVDWRRAKKAAAPVSSSPAEEPAKADGDEEPVTTPWHFKALVGLTAVYLGYRFVQGIEWVVHKL